MKIMGVLNNSVTEAYERKRRSGRIIIYLEKWQRAARALHAGLPFAFALRYELATTALQLPFKRIYDQFFGTPIL